MLVRSILMGKEDPGLSKSRKGDKTSSLLRKTHKHSKVYITFQVKW